MIAERAGIEPATSRSLVQRLTMRRHKPSKSLLLLKPQVRSVTVTACATWLAGDGAHGQWAWSTYATVSASQEQTLSGRGARVYTAHRGWLGVVTGISAASTGGVLVML